MRKASSERSQPLAPSRKVKRGAPSRAGDRYGRDMHDDAFCRFISGHVEALVAGTGHGVDALFGDRVIDDFTTLPGDLAHAAGCIEGAAIALGVTVLEMLDELDLSERSPRARPIPRS